MWGGQRDRRTGPDESGQNRVEVDALEHGAERGGHGEHEVEHTHAALAAHARVQGGGLHKDGAPLVQRRRVTQPDQEGGVSVHDRRLSGVPLGLAGTADAANFEAWGGAVWGGVGEYAAMSAPGSLPSEQRTRIKTSHALAARREATTSPASRWRASGSASGPTSSVEASAYAGEG